MHTSRAGFAVGQVVHHKLFDYRGVIIDVDPVFSATEQWYQAVARSKPPKDCPWYHVLVHNSNQQTYVAERNLELHAKSEPVSHPLLSTYFCGFENGSYLPQRRQQ